MLATTQSAKASTKGVRKMATTYALTYADYSKEKAVTTFHVSDAVLDASLNSLRDAVEAISLGVLQQNQKSRIVKVSNGYPATPDAQREEKLEISYQDNSTLDKYIVSIPCLDKSAVTFITNTDFIEFDPTAGTPTDADTLALQINTVARSPLGNPVTVLTMKYVGRNS